MPVILHRPYAGESSYCGVSQPDSPRFTGPLAFIAGPIMGAPDFQTPAGAAIVAAMPENEMVHIADPRWTNIPPDGGRLAPNHQRAWEKRHYRAAARLGERGVVLFYIAAETSEAPVPNRPGRAYGQGTRSEFSEVIGMMQTANHPVQLVLGIDAAHSGTGLGEYRHTAAEFGIPIHEGLQPTCQAAAALLINGLRTQPAV
ncbi:MAG TPA: hypothetical protein VLF62_04765 [Candidatus Saccharimonadales bacterium]|nr:hypothetical protein [Candidatus Saccharimonadales bacterium]